MPHLPAGRQAEGPPTAGRPRRYIQTFCNYGGVGGARMPAKAVPTGRQARRYKIKGGMRRL